MGVEAAERMKRFVMKIDFHAHAFPEAFFLKLKEYLSSLITS
jgi:hypothetical protein